MKFILMIICFLSISIEFTMADEQIRKRLLIEEPLKTSMFKQYSFVSDENVDPLKLKTIIANGDIYTLEQLYPSDIQIGALSKEELLLLRNMIYAKYGYKFEKKELLDYYSYFEWYKEIDDNSKIIIPEKERGLIKRILDFENPNKIDYPFLGKTTIWREFNGGADQEGGRIVLNSDGSFTYEMSQGVKRTESYKGIWSYTNKELILKLLEQDYIFGGYIHDHPNTPYIENGIRAIIKYDEPILIKLPIQDSSNYFKNDKIWIKIGSNSFILQS